MNSLVIPPSPNWYEASILSCAPDNTLVYGARNDLVVIHDSQKDQPADIRIIPKAHSQKIVSVNLNKNWGQPNKFLVSVGDDKVVKLWNLETFEKKLSHSVHKIHTRVVGATFAGDERIISVSEEGAIVVWNVGLNQPNLLKDVFGFKVTVTSLSTCPHANWLTAFGLKNGLVVIADLRKQGKILYKLRGHDKPVVSLAWCPVPVNIFPKDPHNHVGLKKVQNIPELPSEKVENVESTTYKPKKNNGIWTNLKHVDDDELPKEYKLEEKTHPLLKVYESDDDDFLKECQKLKQQILGEDTPKKCEIGIKIDQNSDRPILKAKKSLKVGPIEDKELQQEENLEKDVTEKCDNEEDKETVEAVEDKLTTVEDAAEEKETVESVENVLEEVLTLGKKEDKEVLVESKLEESSTEKGKCEENDASSNEAEESVRKTVDEEAKNSEVSSSEMKREIPVNVSVEEEPRKEFLLATSAKEGHIYIWRAGTDGRMQTFLTSPGKNNNRRPLKGHPDKMWITLCWISPNMLLSSSKNGELLHWTLPKPKDKSNQFRLVHNDHSSLLFSVAGPIMILNENNWLDVDIKKLNVWTVGQDRLLLNTSLSSERTNLCCYPTVGVVECFVPSPLDPTRLAIGTGEGIIKIWDLSRPHVKNIFMTNFYQKIQSKVITLAWHPTNELQLAYGTMEGRVGYFDVNNKSKSPTLLPNFFKSQVHKIEWGPLNGDKENLGLFAVAEGKLIAFNPKKSEKDPIEVDTPDNTYVYTFSWKPDYEMLLVTSKTGALIVYSTDLKITSTHYLQRKLQSIYWHPDATQGDRNVSKYCYWFASVFNSAEIVVYDFGIESENNDEKIVAKLKASDAINSLAWSPFEANQLVVGTDDGVAQIFNIEDGTVLATFVNANFESILAITWSPIDADYVISAGKDHTIRIWKVSDHPAKTDKDISELKKKYVKESPEDSTEVPSKTGKSQEEPPKPKKPNKNNVLPNFYNPKNNSQIIADLRKLLAWKENPSCVETQPKEEPNLLHVFGSNDDMLKIIQANELCHKSRGKYNLNNTLSLFKGDISTAIKDAIEQKRVTPWTIMMAPMVSPRLWKTACEVYAQQLSEELDSDPLETATYYLACHKIEEAVNVLCEGALFREALALAKCRLPADDPLVTTVIEKWASYSLIVGNFEVAAQCNVFLGKYEEAASVLFRRSDVETLEFATELAEKSGNEELRKAVVFRCNAFKKEEDKENGELPSKVEVEEKEGSEKCEKEGSEKCDKKEEIKTEENGKMSKSVDCETFQNGVENAVGYEVKKSSSLGDNFRLSFDETNEERKILEDGSGDNNLLKE